VRTVSLLEGNSAPLLCLGRLALRYFLATYFLTWVDIFLPRLIEQHPPSVWVFLQLLGQQFLCDPQFLQSRVNQEAVFLLKL